MNERPIYLDYMATTPVDPRVIAVMNAYLGPDGCFGNPASTTHVYGLEAARAVDGAREQIASVFNASSNEIIFTSGATEGNNLAIIGAARFYQSKGKHLITMSTEHKAVLDSMHQLEKEGFTVTYLEPRSDGLLDLNSLEQALQPDTILVSIMHVNNEIGVIQNINEIGALLKDKGIVFHVDAAQSAGKIQIDVAQTNVDLISISGHKIYGPKGIGALYVRHKPRVRLLPLSFGGGHEGGMRSGTLATHQIVGLSEALKIAHEGHFAEQARILEYRNRIWDGIKHLPGLRLNGHAHQRIAGNLNITFYGYNSDSLLFALRELAISKTSACSSSSAQPSYVLKAIGLTDDLAHSSVRLSIGRFTQEEQIDRIVNIICTEVTRLKEMSPL